MAASDLGPHVSALLRTASSLSEAQLTTTAEAVLQAVCGGASAEQTLAPHSWAQQPAARDAVAAIAAVVTHAASFKLTGDQVKGRQRPQNRSFLTTKVPNDSGLDMHSTASLRDDHGWSEPRAAALTAAYDAARYAAALGSGLLLPHINIPTRPACSPTQLPSASSAVANCVRCTCSPSCGLPLASRVAGGWLVLPWRRPLSGVPPHARDIAYCCHRGGRLCWRFTAGCATAGAHDTRAES